MKIERPKGTRDFLPEEMAERRHAEAVISSLFQRYGYGLIKTPAFEHADLFMQKSGEEVKGHMYVFEDKKGRMLCLRPEETASVARMYSESLRNLPMPVKVYYFDSMFRYEEPQKGRYREFWQLGVELLGPKSVYADAEVVALAHESLKALGLSFELQISHLGVIKGVLSKLKLSEKKKAEVLALIDKKDFVSAKKIVKEKALYELIELSGDRSILGKAGSILSGFEEAGKALAELNEVAEILNELNVKYKIDFCIARGLEYYTGMVFEVRVEGLGAQNQIAGGGRYDNLIELFSGLSVPAVGFAFGFDRVIEAMKHQKVSFPKKGIEIVVAPVSADVRLEALKIATELRKSFSVDIDLMDRKLAKILEYASQVKARYAIIVGRKDLEAWSVTLRDMSSGDQELVEVAVLGQEISKRME